MQALCVADLGATLEGLREDLQSFRKREEAKGMLFHESNDTLLARYLEKKIGDMRLLSINPARSYEQLAVECHLDSIYRDDLEPLLWRMLRKSQINNDRFLLKLVGHRTLTVLLN